MQIHQLKPKNPNQWKKRIGRGGAHGKTAGRGEKGQKSRAGRKIRPAIRDLIKKFPKLRGRGKNSFKSLKEKNNVRTAEVKISHLEKMFKSGDLVNPKSLVAKGLVNLQAKKIPEIKLLASGILTKKLIVSKCQISSRARKKIEKAGGEILNHKP